MKPAHLLFSQLVALIPSRSILQTLVIFSGGEFLNTACIVSKFRKTKKKSFTSSKKVK